MEFPATGSGLMDADVLLPAGVAPGHADLTQQPPDPLNVSAFLLIERQAGVETHVGDYIGLVQNAPPGQAGPSLNPGDAGLRWAGPPWPPDFYMYATMALGVQGSPAIQPQDPQPNPPATPPAPTTTRQPAVVQNGVWARYRYRNVDPTVVMPSASTIVAAAGEHLYRITFQDGGVGALHVALPAASGASTLTWFIPHPNLTTGNPSRPWGPRQLIDLRKKTEFVAAAQMQVGNLIMHVDTPI